ncbi:MAG: NHL repeat-containing protein [Thermoleophilia bacterium]
MRMRAILCAAACGLFALPAVAAAQAGIWGGKGDDPGRFGEIIDVATDARGYVYVLDEPDGTYGEGRVQKFLPNGKLVRQWGGSSDDDVRPLDRPNLISEPLALAISPQGLVYVAEGGERTRISIWTGKGKFQGAFASGGSGPGQISASIGGMVVDGRGLLVVADGGNDRLGLFTLGGQPAGETVVSFPADADGYTQTLSPTGDIAAGGDGRLYLAASYGVAIVDPSGAIVGAFGGDGTGPGAFSSVSGVAVAGDTLYATDARLSRVQQFTAAGAFVAPVGGAPGGQPGQFTSPGAVAADCRGAAYVADTGNFRIQRFGPTAPPCSNFAKDPGESLTIRLAGPKIQDFREEFAVQPRISCDRPCAVTLTGTITTGGRKIRLVTERFRLNYPDLFTANIAPTERGTDVVVAALRRDRRATARIRMTVKDLTGTKKVRSAAYRLR